MNDTSSHTSEPLLSVRNLVTEIKTPQGILRAVDELTFDIPKRTTLCLVGESGCGKSMTGLSIMGLVPDPPVRVTSGEIVFQGQDLLKLSARQMRRMRGQRIAMIFQDPMTSLNPVRTIGSQMKEMFTLHQPELAYGDVQKRMVELLGWVGLPDPALRLQEYPHQLSGGMRQRVMIAMALSCNPDLLIADEPTTALDVTIQAQILELFQKIQDNFDMSLLLITHDFGVVAQMANQVAVMYAGRVVELGSAEEVLARTNHPYTYGLLKSIPDPKERLDRLYTISGVVPQLNQLPKGCRFSNRCPHVIDGCRTAVPALIADQDKGHPAACIRPQAWERS